MIVVYPMLVSKAVGGNILPGISKMLENYLVVYNMNDILGNIKTARKVNYKIRGKKLFEGDYSPVVIEEADDDWMEPGTKKPKPEVKDDDKISKQDRSKENERKQKEFEYKKERDKAKDILDKEKERKEKEEKEKLKAAEKTKASADVGDMKGIALEPTFIKIKMQDGSTDFIGVKVVPIRVKSDAKLSHLMANDLSFGFIRSSLIGVGRKILRWFYLKITPSKRVDTPTGDARKDMFYARTGLKGNAFVILDKNEDIDSTLYSNPRLVVKLFGLSWGNMILADDINRRAYFCMKKFKGICSMIPYSMLYQALGQKQVFDDLEDARQKSGALFKRKPVKLQKVVGEHYAHLKLSDYQILGEDLNHGKNR